MSAPNTLSAPNWTENDEGDVVPSYTDGLNGNAPAFSELSAIKRARGSQIYEGYIPADQELTTAAVVPDIEEEIPRDELPPPIDYSNDLSPATASRAPKNKPGRRPTPAQRNARQHELQARKNRFGY